MYIVDSYGLAVLFCFITMLCWGSWANTSKIATDKWPFPLYYWDYSLGLILISLIYAFTMGSIGESGRSFIDDLAQADFNSLTSAFLGGVIFNLSNLLIVAAIAVAGLSVAFPIGVGLALVIGVFVNYLKVPEGNPWILFTGVSLVVLAIIFNAIASARVSRSRGTTPVKGIVLSVMAGIIMGFFYRFVADGMTLDFTNPEAGKLTAYTAVFVFSIGLFISNFLWNSFFMYKPIEGSRSTYADYFSNGTRKQHLIGLLGGIIFNTGFLFNLLASDKAGPAISYGLGQGATMVGAAWGVFVFKEFASAPKSTNTLLIAMFITFITGLALIIAARII
ncbi:MAG: multidrug DMT transporter permease [Cyclobacteriaceae bacterium]|nr:multidrug DMT transporter permease [Cyclobacteriaceae bacterium]